MSSEPDYEDLLDKVLDNVANKEVSEDRFKIPDAEILHEGNTTIIKNFDKIANKVNRNPNQILKFLLDGLGTAGEIEGGRVVFQGKIPTRKVKSKIDEYIDTFVICSECGRPDTHLVKKGRTTLIRCDACGAFRSEKSQKKKVISQEKEELQEGKTYDLTIKDIGKKGDGVAFYNDYVIFVPGTMKGSEVKVRIKKISGTIAFGEKV